MLLRLWRFESTHTHIKFGSVAQNGQSGSKRRAIVGRESEIWSCIFAEELKTE